MLIFAWRQDINTHSSLTYIYLAFIDDDSRKVLRHKQPYLTYKYLFSSYIAPRIAHHRHAEFIGHFIPAI